MDYKVEVDVLLHDLGKIMNLQGLSLDSHNRCILIFDEKIVVNLELNEITGELILYSYVAAVPFEGKERIFEFLLESNFFWKDSKGATLSIDKQTQTIVMSYKFCLPLKDPEKFEDSLGFFVDNVESWAKRVESMALDAEVVAQENNANKLNKNEDRFR
ncbi:MAG: type III secretion system chaperone [Puniceicoccales bacterium]|jgi:hypothetical protein|nr:type III secretion system chaperone [Puniceicoccales bacterium]